MKLEEGMFIRNHLGRIEKIQTLEPYNDKQCINNHEYSNNVIKASHNIIDLIEKGDYVNGLYVVESSLGLGIIAFSEDLEVLNSCNNYKGNEWIIPNIFYKLQDFEIKTIVTKQQFESMQYEVE